MPVEFVCQDCAAEVWQAAPWIEAPPDPPRCSVCQWLAELPDPVVRAQMRAGLGVPFKGGS